MFICSRSSQNKNRTLRNLIFFFKYAFQKNAIHKFSYTTAKRKLYSWAVNALVTIQDDQGTVIARSASFEHIFSFI